jgi:pyruvate kinase
MTSGSEAPASQSAEAASQSDEFASLFEELLDLHGALGRAEAGRPELLAELGPDERASARNLLHYLTLRSRDLRGVQDRLTRQGLSSLGRAESHVLWNLEAILGLLRRLQAEQRGREPRDALSPQRAIELLERRTRALFGPPPAERAVRIMVTMPKRAAKDYDFIRDLVAAGMDCMRINCAHDNPEAWQAMIGHLRRAEHEVGRPCGVLMDLPGPRVRTGPLPAGPEVLRIGPLRDAYGRVQRPARVWLTPAEQPAKPPTEPRGVLPLPGHFLAAVAAGDHLTFRDTRGKRRRLQVTETVDASRWAELDDVAFIRTGTSVTHERNHGAVDAADTAPAMADSARSSAHAPRLAAVGTLPARERFIRLRPGDRLVLTRDPGDVRPVRVDPQTGEREPARVAVLPVEILGALGVGQRIWFDDGRIGGVIREVGDDVVVEITGARAAGEKLKAEKGINLPDTVLPLPSLTHEDLSLIPFIAQHADLIGYSFVRSADDVRLLRTELARAGGDALGVMLKVETVSAFRQLPAMLLEGLRGGPFGVMIARGDLAVESGFVRMAEVQEEILWLAEAAHVPVVWATQVMEALVKKGRPTRAEATDAAMAERAECVMLNKGEHVLDGVRALVSIFAAMSGHQRKKSAMLRRLEVAAAFTDTPADAAAG